MIEQTRPEQTHSFGTIVSSSYAYRQPPIPLPCAPVKLPSFKPAFSRVFRVYWCWIMLCYYLPLWLVYGPQFQGLGLARYLLLSQALVLLFTLASVHGFQVFADENGLSSYNFWGVYTSVAWSDVNHVQPVNLCGLRYLRLHYEGSRNVVWLPLFLDDLRAFKALVNANTVAEHPLRLFINGKVMDHFTPL